MPYSVKSLFKISMYFVVKHINLVESFVGFPSLVAEEICKRFAIKYNGENNDSIQSILRKFVEAYENLFLERLNLSGSLLILNEHFETIVIISRFVIELCVCGCFLGVNHELFSHISEFKCLKKLCMKNNSMNDSSLRLLTLRIRIYGIGGKEVETLNIADNSFTDDMIPWLCAFPNLQYLNLSGSKISEEGIRTLAIRYHLMQVFESGAHEDVRSEGWAVAILEKWIRYNERRRKRKENRLIRKSLPTVVKPLPDRLSNPTLIFRKTASSESPAEPSAKKRKTSANCDMNRKIEEDLFSQYA